MNQLTQRRRKSLAYPAGPDHKGPWKWERAEELGECVMLQCRPWSWRQGPQAKARRRPLGAGRQERRVPAQAARRSSAFQTSDLQTCKSINPLCFKPLSWWQSVTVVEETRALAILSRCGQVNGVCRGPGGD